MDRNRIYFHLFTGDNGWNYRGEIRPAGDHYAFWDNEDEFSEGFLSIKNAKFGFGEEGLPIGAALGSSMTVELDYSKLPQNLQEILANPFYADEDFETFSGSNSNLFLLFSDRGEGGDVKDYLEFAGAQQATLQGKYTIEDGAPTTVEYQFFALEKIVAEETATEAIATAQLALTPLGTSTTAYDYKGTESAVTRQKYVQTDTNMEFYSLHTFLLAAFENQYCFAGRNYLRSTLNSVPEVTNTPFHALTFYEPLDDHSNAFFPDPFTAGTPVPVDEILIIGGMLSFNAGFFSNDIDGENIREYTTLWEFIKDLCDFTCVKFRMRCVADATKQKGVRFEIEYHRLYENRRSHTALDFTKVQESTFTIETCANVIQKVQVDFPNIPSDNLESYTATSSGHRADGSVAPKAIFHNLPTYPHPSPGALDLFAETIPVYRKLFYHDATRGYLKVHEAVHINDGDGLYLTNAPLPYEEVGGADLEGWVLKIQETTGLPKAVADFLIAKFGGKNQHLITCKLPLDADNLMPEDVGEYYEVTLPDNFTGTHAWLLEATPDFLTGIMECKFLTAE
jgi:hypothetical protein